MRVLTITGMAGGLTVLFGAPLGAALFALEILHRRGLQYYEALLPALIGSLFGYGVYVALDRSGDRAGLEVPHRSGHPTGVDLLAAVGLGLVAGLCPQGRVRGLVSRGVAAGVPVRAPVVCVPWWAA